MTLEEKIKKLERLYQRYGSEFGKHGIYNKEIQFDYTMTIDLRKEVDEIFTISAEDWEDYLNNIKTDGEFAFKRFSIPVNEKEIINYEAIIPKAILAYFPFIFSQEINLNDEWSKFIWTGTKGECEFAQELIHKLEIFGNFIVIKCSVLKETEMGKTEKVLRDNELIASFNYDKNGQIHFDINRLLFADTWDADIISIVKGKLAAQEEMKRIRK